MGQLTTGPLLAGEPGGPWPTHFLRTYLVKDPFSKYFPKTSLVVRWPTHFQMPMRALHGGGTMGGLWKLSYTWVINRKQIILKAAKTFSGIKNNVIPHLFGGIYLPVDEGNLSQSSFMLELKSESRDYRLIYHNSKFSKSNHIFSLHL